MTPAIHPQLAQRFATTFGGQPHCIAFAPGRINLVGDHIDYCGGTVLPMTIQRGTWVAARRASHGRARARSDNYHGTFDGDLPCRMEDTEDTPWARYLVGVLKLLAREGIAVPRGIDLFVISDLPTGGLSSSAALCVALTLAIEALAGRTLEGGRAALARLCQRVEHDYVGLQCGIMDQAVIALSPPDHALALDCRDLSFAAVPVPAQDPCFLVLDSGHARTLANAPYNARQDDARRAEAVLAPRAGVADLCAITPEAFAALAGDPALGLDEIALRRARHCVSEQARVQAAVSALRARDWAALGAAMRASHDSLRDDFEASCEELDCLVEAACAQPGVYGARLTGAGFGGAAIALLDLAAVPAATAGIDAAFAARFGRTPPHFVAHPGGGACLLQAPA